MTSAGIFFQKSTGCTHYFGLRITVSALLITERPFGVKGGKSTKSGVSIYNFGQSIGVKEEIIQVAALYSKIAETVVGSTKIENRFVGIVEKNAVQLFLLRQNTHIKGRRTVNRIGIFAITKWSVFQSVSSTSPIKISCFFCLSQWSVLPCCNDLYYWCYHPKRNAKAGSSAFRVFRLCKKIKGFFEWEHYNFSAQFQKICRFPLA